MSKRKIVAIVIFLLIGFTTFTFAGTDLGTNEPILLGDEAEGDNSLNNENDLDDENEETLLFAPQVNNEDLLGVGGGFQPGVNGFDDLINDNDEEEDNEEHINPVDPTYLVSEAHSKGTKNEAIYSILAINFYDDKLDYITLNGNVLEDNIDAVLQSLTLNKNTNGIIEGTNTLTAYDKDGNSITYTFIMDFTAPVINDTATNLAIVDGGYYNVELKINVKDENALSYLEKNTVIHDLTSKDNKVKLNSSVEKEHYIIATDKAGNTTRVDYTLDMTPVNITVIEDKTEGNIDYNIYSLVRFKLFDSNMLSHVELNGTLLKDGFNTTVEKVTVDTTTNGVILNDYNTLTAYDTAGNKTEYVFFMDNKRPKYNELSFVGDNTLHNKIFSDLSLEVTDNAGISKITVNGNEIDLGESLITNYVFDELLFTEGSNKIVTYDFVGRKSIYKFEYDVTAPSIAWDKVYSNEYYQYDFTNLNKENILGRVTGLEPEYSTNVKITYAVPYGEASEVESLDGSKIGTYTVTVTATDKAGNVSEISHKLTNDYRHQKLICDVVGSNGCDIYLGIEIGGIPVLFDSIPYVVAAGKSLPTINVDAREFINGVILNGTDIQNSVTIDTSNVNMNKTGVYDVVVSATDWTGTVSSRTVKIQVVDLEAPVITLSETQTIDKYVNLGWLGTYTVKVPAYTAIDNVDGDITDKVNVSVTGTPLTGYVVTYTVTDEAGWPAVKVITVK